MIKKILINYLSFEKIEYLGSVKSKIKYIIYRIVDILFCPVTIIAAILFRYLRVSSLTNFPLSKKILLKIGVFPIIDHYYEPLFNHKHLRYSLRKDRELPGIDFNDTEQLRILDSFNYNEELLQFPLNKRGNQLEYYYKAEIFTFGDAEYLYNIIRLFRPKKIIEIGSGYSTLMSKNAIRKNIEDNIEYNCEHTCIEPYQNNWLKEIGVNLIIKKVEEVELDVFKSLQKNDILFIDSTHIIRPQGDVLYEYLEILPTLNKGVLIHIHDIFTPKDYRDIWVGENFWNEQYLLEAFLSFNKDFRIIGATNYLSHKYSELFSGKCPMYKKFPDAEPGSFWMIRN